MSMKGKRLRTRHLEVRAVASPLPHPRIGFVVPRHKQTAVDRNRLKRRLREIVRLHLLRFLPPLDVVIRTKPGAYGAAYQTLEDELVGLRELLAEQRSQ